jgi:putative flippase GtrA
MSLLGFAPVAANAFGYLVGLFTSFVLNRRWTFNDSSRLLPSLVRFVQVVAVAYLFNLGAMWIVWRGLDADPYAAQVFGTVIYVTTFFVGSKFFVFRAEAFRGEKETL